MIYVGIDLGGTKIAAGLVNENGEIIRKDSVSTKRDRSANEIVKDMALLAKKVILDHNLTPSEVHSIGIGCPGTPDIEAGVLVYANNLPFNNYPIRAEIQKFINIPVHIENDANCAALAESVAGAAKDIEHSTTITLGTGVGGGVVVNRKVYSGFNNAASEIGHMVILSGGEHCTCGRRGCWEAYASATALIEQTKRAAQQNPSSLIHILVNGDLSRVNAKTAFDAAKAEDEVGKKVVDQYIHYLAEGLANVVNIFQPEVIVIGGGVCNEGEYLLAPLREIVRRESYSSGDRRTEIRVAQMGNDAGIIGAAMLGR